MGIGHIVVGSVIACVLATACTGDAGDVGGSGSGGRDEVGGDREPSDDAGTSEAGGRSAAPGTVAGSGEVVIAHCAPATLLPADNLEVCGSEILAQLFTPLVTYDAETGEPVEAVAASIETTDQRVWDIALHDGWTFSDGERVTASSFADAWDVAAQPGRTNATYLQPIAGWDDVADGSATHLAGVEVLDDLHLRITLARPFSQLPLLLGFNPFFPMTRAAIEDPDRFASAPVGNGPYRIVEELADAIVLEAVARYAGDPAHVARVTYRYFDDRAEGFAALEGGEVDIAEAPPGEAFGAFADQLVAGDGATLQYLALPVAAPPWDRQALRRALSLAIDRAALAEDVREGAARPAAGLIPPAAVGSRDAPCDACRFDPDSARVALEDAGGVPAGGLALQGAGDPLVEAIAAMWREVLRIDVEVLPGSGVDGLDAPDAAGAALAGWTLDYLSPQNALQPLFASGGAANHTGYANSDVDALIARGNAAGSQEEAVQLYRQAEDLLLRDLPAIPLLFDRRLVVHDEGVERLVLDRSGQIALRHLELGD